MTAIVAFELLTRYAEDTEQWVWPLLNQLENSLPTILTSRCRIVIEGEYKASRPGDRLPLAMLRASAQQAGTLSALEILLHPRAVPACAAALSGKPSWTNQLLLCAVRMGVST